MKATSEATIQRLKPKQEANSLKPKQEATTQRHGFLTIRSNLNSYFEYSIKIKKQLHPTTYHQAYCFINLCSKILSLILIL